jgi:hypothetical protein
MQSLRLVFWVRMHAVYAYLVAYFATYDSCQFNAYTLAHMVSWLEPS